MLKKDDNLINSKGHLKPLIAAEIIMNWLK